MKMTTTMIRSVFARSVAVLRRFATRGIAIVPLFLIFATLTATLQAQHFGNLHLGDFNGDGIPDVLLQNPVPANNTSTFTLTFGAVPFGSFSAVSRNVPYPAGCSGQPTGVSIGDFNGDRRDDIVLNCPAVNGPITTYVLLSTGDGSFTVSATLPGLRNLLIGDFNHDGKLDLVEVGPNGTQGEQIRSFLGVGDGTFGTPTSTTIQATAYSAALAVDLNKDGYPDIVLGNFSDQDANSLDIYGNNQNGGFGAAGSPNAPNASVRLGPGSSGSILSGNFFGSGLPDLGVVDGNANFSTIKNNSTDGFSFGPSAAVDAAHGTVFAASFTSSFSDLLVATETNLSVLVNDGAGNFLADRYPSLTIGERGNQSYAVSDANFDGYADIFTATLTATGVSLAVDLVSGTASASSTPFSLPLGSSPVSAAWSGNVNFSGSTLTGTQIVGGITPIIKWPAPAPISYGTALSATQLDATAVTSAGVAIPGTFAYTPDAGTVLDTGTQTLAVTFTPTDLVTYTVANSTALLMVNQATPIITWNPNPATIVALTPLTAGQLDATSSTPGTFVYTPALGAMLVSGTQTLSTVFTPTDTLNFKTVTATTTILVTTKGISLNPGSISFANQTVGLTSAAQVITVTNLNATTVNISQIVIQAGANPFDFNETNNCPAALLAGGTCQITVTFTPKGVGLRVAAVTIFDDSTPASQGVDLNGTGAGGILQVNPGNLKTIAGNGTFGYTGDGGVATSAELGSPNGLAFDSKGNLYIADLNAQVVRRVDKSGIITTFAGTGTAGYTGDGGAATSAKLNQPFSVAVDAADNVYIQDTGNYVIRKVDASGVISTFAGTGVPGHLGDGGPAIDARFNQNQGARFDKAGNLYVPQCLGASVRKIDTQGVVTTVAGNFTEGFSGDGGQATSAQLQCPSGVAIDNAGNLFIADFYNNRIRKVDTAGIITTIAGDGTAAFSGDGGPAVSAEVNLPNDVAFDLAGNLYIADSNNGRIRKIDTKGIITSVAGGFENAGSPGVSTPSSLTSDAAGNMYFTDGGHSTVSEIFPAGTAPLPTTPLGSGAAPQTLTLSNVGNLPITIGAASAFALSGDSADFTLSGGTCLAGVTLEANGGSCTLQITFKPTMAGQRSLVVSVVDNALNSPQSFSIGGTAAQATPTIAWPAPAPIPYGVPLGAAQLNATATDITGAPLPGVFVYTPAAGSTPNPGLQTLSVTFTPTDIINYMPVTATVTITITDVTLSSFTPNTVSLGAPATTITITGTGLVSTTVVQVNGTAIPTTLVNATTLTAIIPASDFLAPGTLLVTLTNPTTGSTSTALDFTVTAPALSGTLSGPPTTPPGTQPNLTISIPPYPVDITAVLTVSLKSSLPSGITDAKNVVFANGNNTYTFTVKAGSTSIPAIPLAAGTVAETITVTPVLLIGTTDVTPAGLAPVVIGVPAAVPQAMSTTLTRSGKQITVTIVGFSNTREIASAAFHFVAAPGATLVQPDFSPTVDPLFTTWYEDPTSSDYGSSFTYTQVFDVSDLSTSIGSVQVTLTNSIGTSTMETAQ